MAIFTKGLGDITYDEVVAFCEQGIAEGVNLDYKKEFPPEGWRLAKTISAFANTFGGVVIIGVEDEDSRPKPPYEGIDDADGLGLRVENIVLDNIYPPVFPQIRVCPPADGKTFVIVRVPQSNDTPHAIYNKTKVYIRTGDRNMPEGLATIERLDWLRNRRQKSEDLRERLAREARERYENICKSIQVNIKGDQLTLSSSPLFPLEPLLSVEDIETTVRQIQAPSVATRSFPRLEGGMRPVQDGAVSFSERIIVREEVKLRLIDYYLEVNRFGVVLFKEHIQGREIYLNSLTKLLTASFEGIADFYKEVGFWGLIELVLRLEEMLGASFVPLTARGQHVSERPINITDDTLVWKVETTVAGLSDPVARQAILIDLFKKIAWSFGWKQHERALEENLKELGKWAEEDD